jgi:hypothetical protein
MIRQTWWILIYLLSLCNILVVVVVVIVIIVVVVTFIYLLLLYPNKLCFACKEVEHIKAYTYLMEWNNRSG